MPAARPSVTSQVVALARAQLDRPHSPAGDPQAQARLCEGMTLTPPEWLTPGVAARTGFIDGLVAGAITAGTAQVVICGAGYDDRALRFPAAGVRFFELDHPGTQQDKARRLRALGAGPPEVTLAAADFGADDAGAVLAGAGHDPARPTVFICEGLLVYLPAATCRVLLAALAARAAAGSVLAASLATHAAGADTAEVVAEANSRRRAAGSEPWRTILPEAEHLALVEQAGWTVTRTLEAPPATPTVSYGRRTLLVQAVPGLSAPAA